LRIRSAEAVTMSDTVADSGVGERRSLRPVMHAEDLVDEVVLVSRVRHQVAPVSMREAALELLIPGPIVRSAPKRIAEGESPPPE
jgi:hypothetical protein